MFDPKELLGFVEKIRRKSELQNEAGIRTAINRSYYSSLLKAKLRLEEKGENFSKNDEIHKDIIEKIKNKDSSMGDKLNDLHELRVQADFDLNFKPDKDFISHAYGIAKSFNGKINSRIN